MGEAKLKREQGLAKLIPGSSLQTAGGRVQVRWETESAATPEAEGIAWLDGHLNESVAALLDAPWILDIDTTVKPLYGKQEGAVIAYNPKKPGRPSHSYHTYPITPT